MPIGQFKKAAPAAKAPPKKSRWAGVKAAQPRDPMPHAGIYRFRVVSCEEGYNPGKARSSFKTTLEIVAQEDGQTIHREGDQVMAIFMLSTNAGQSRAKSFVMAAAGYEDDESYDAFDPDGEFIDACLGHKNAYSERSETVVGRLVDCRVTRGGETGDGDYYREYEWGIVSEGEQS